MLIRAMVSRTYIQSERARVHVRIGSEHLANAILCTPRFSAVDYVKQKVPVQQDRPQHSIVRETKRERRKKEEGGERRRVGRGERVHCICSRRASRCERGELDFCVFRRQ